MNTTPQIVCTLLIWALLFCNDLVAGTNELWFLRVNNSFLRGLKDVSIQQACKLLEIESQKLDKSGRGVRIVFALTPFENEMQTFHFNGSGFGGQSLIETLTTMVRCADLGLIVTEDVAIIGRLNYRCVSVALTGKCFDSRTGKSINTFCVESTPWAGVLSVSTNGCYICALPCLVNLLVNDDILLPSGEMFKTKKDFKIIAPGYKDRTFSVDIFLPGKTGYQEFNIPLEPNP